PDRLLVATVAAVTGRPPGRRGRRRAAPPSGELPHDHDPHDHAEEVRASAAAGREAAHRPGILTVVQSRTITTNRLITPPGSAGRPSTGSMVAVAAGGCPVHAR